MIYATLIKINKDAGAELLIGKEASCTVRDFQLLGKDTSVSMQISGDVSPLKTLPFRNQVELAHRALSLFKNLNNDQYALLRHNDKDPATYQDIEFIQCLNGRLRVKRIANPLWRHATVPLRRKNTLFRDFNITLSGQSQLFAMLSANDGDALLKAQFGIEDFQQDPVYQWESEVYEHHNSLPLQALLSLARNVLMEPRLPLINIRIAKDGNAAKFSLSSGEPSKSSKDNECDLRDIIQSPAKVTYEAMQAPTEKPFSINLSQLSLTFPASWALSPPVIIHELSHYIAFCLPSPYQLNRGVIHMSWASYQTLFSGHGAVWLGIYLRGLIDYAYLNAEQLYASATEAGLLFIKTPTLKITDINNAITAFLEKNQQ